MGSKAHRGVRMEGRVASWYDARARKEHDENQALARRVTERLPAGSTVLEVAPGPGYLAIELAKLGSWKVTGLDISETFVRIARENAARDAVEVDFRQGDVANMPFEGERFDVIVCRAAFQNFSRPGRALEEMRRVLKTGGTGVVIDVRRDVGSQSINTYTRKVSTGLVNWLSNQLVFRLVLIRRAYGKDTLKGFIAAAGLCELEIREGPMFLEVWFAKDIA